MSHNKPIFNYAEKLRDPRWQKKRLEIMQRDNFTCQECKSTDKTLNVHHCFYKQWCDPWDYPEKSLVTLCEECHQFESDSIKEAKNFLFNSLASLGFRTGHFHQLDFEVWHNFLNNKNPNRLNINATSLFVIFSAGIEQFVKDVVGRKTDSATSKHVPTGEGSSAGDTVERKSDA